MAITLGALTVVTLGRSISVRCPYTGTLAGDEVATLEWKRNADGTWIEGHALYHDTRANLGINQTNFTNPYANEFRGMVLGLTPEVSYDVRVSVTGTGVVGSPSSSTANTTKAESPTLPTNTILYVATTGSDANDGLSAGSPKLTINGAIAAASGATQIRVAQGTYTATSSPLVTISVNDIAIVGFGGIPVLDGASLYNLFTITGNNFILQQLDMRKAGNQHCIRLNSTANDGWIDTCLFSDWNAGNDANQLSAAIRVSSGAGLRLAVSNCAFNRRDQLAGEDDGRGNGIWVQAGASIQQSGYRFFDNTFVGGFDAIGGEPNFSANSVRGPYTDSEIYGNTIQDVSDDGMELDGACMNVAVCNNTFKGKAVSGISADSLAVGPLFVVRNIFDLPYNNNSQVGLGGFKAFKVGHDRGPSDTPYTGGRAYVYHNTANIKDLVGAGSTPSCNVVDGNDGGWNNWTAKNNIFRNDGPTTKYLMEIGGSAKASYGHEFDYNCWWFVGTAGAWRIKWYANTSIYGSFALWQGGGYDVNGKNIDPNAEWTGPANSNYNLKAGSQLIGAGVAITGINDANMDDSTWRMNGAAPDMGAIESAGGTTVTVTVIPLSMTGAIPTPTSVGGGTKVVAPVAVLLGTVGTPSIAAGAPQVINEYWSKARKQGVSHLLHAG